MYVQDIPLFPPTETLKKKKQHICSYLSTYIKLQTAETAPLQFVYFYCIYWLKFVSYKKKMFAYTQAKVSFCFFPFSSIILFYIAFGTSPTNPACISLGSSSLNTSSIPLQLPHSLSCFLPI